MKNTHDEFKLQNVYGSRYNRYRYIHTDRQTDIIDRQRDSYNYSTYAFLRRFHLNTEFPERPLSLDFSGFYSDQQTS